MTSFLDLAQSFQLAIKAMLMYTASHPRAEAAIGTLASQLQTWLAAKTPLHIAATGPKLFVDGSPIEGQNLHVTALVRQLTERQISGFVIHRGMNAMELVSMLQILILKPSRIEEQGGVARIMERENLRHITLSQTQYREVREGEGGESEDAGAPSTLKLEDRALAEALREVAPSLKSLTEMVRLWEEEFARTLLPTDFEAVIEGHAAPLELQGLSQMARSLGWGEGPPSDTQGTALKKAVEGLDPKAILALVSSLKTLPPSPGGLNQTLRRMAPELSAQAAARLIAQGMPWSAVKEGLGGVLPALGPSGGASLIEALGGLLPQGFRADELSRMMAWQNLGSEDRIRMVLETKGILDLTLPQRMAFLEELRDEDRLETLLKVLDQLLEALTHENPMVREPGAQTLAGIAPWVRQPGLPGEAEGPFLQGLVAHFGWEPVQRIHHFTRESLESFLGAFVDRGELQAARTLVQELEGLCAFLEGDQAWRKDGLELLREFLCQDDMLEIALETLHGADAQSVLSEVIPYFEFLGATAANHLVRVLGEEPDRRRRARLLDVIRVMGPLALPALQAGLRAEPWFLVRNTLNLLADMGDAGLMPNVAACLEHSDRRVKHAAVRALWKLGGPASAQPLLAFFPKADPDTQVEVLFGLGQIQATAAVEPLLAFAQRNEVPEKLRVRALDTLAQIASPRALTGLIEILKRKGRIFTSAAPTEIRVAAARALAALGIPQAENALRQIVADEPRTKDRDALQQVLDLYQPR